MISLLFLVLLLSSVQTLAKIFQTFDGLSSTAFDYVIVGAGVGGNVIANRLTEDPGVSVLVLEAGGTNEGVLPIQIPFFAPRVTPDTPWDWNYTTSPQQGLSGRSIPYPRGFVLGGSSSVNYLVYTRGSREDYDRYAKLTGDPGWSWDSLKPYIAKNEKLVPPADHHNTAGQYNPAVHSTSGINSVSLASFPSPIDDRIIRTTHQLPNDFPFNLDMNSGKPLGLGWLQATINDGVRSSSATSYLGPSFINRPGLNVLIHARVGRLIKSGMESGKPAFKIVEFKSGGTIHRVEARKEVILSAGSIGSPQILLNSGIGNAKELSKISRGVRKLNPRPYANRYKQRHHAKILTACGECQGSRKFSISSNFLSSLGRSHFTIIMLIFGFSRHVRSCHNSNHKI